VPHIGCKGDGCQTLRLVQHTKGNAKPNRDSLGTGSAPTTVQPAIVMPHPRGPPGIGIDLLHLPRLLRVIFPSIAGSGIPVHTHAYGHACGPETSDLRPVKRFAKRILSLEELGAFERRFLGGNDTGRERWREEVGRWLGVRWAAKEALYKAYPYPWRWPGEGGFRGEGETEGEGEGEGEGERLTWKEVTMRVDEVSGEFSFSVCMGMRGIVGIGRADDGVWFVEGNHIW